MSQAIILVVEDLAEEIVQEALEDAGYRTKIACSQDEVIEQAAGNHIKAIVVDLLMTGVDGLALCRQLRQHPVTQSLPLVAVTGSGDAETQARAQAAGADVCLARPLDWADLERELHRMVSSEQPCALFSLRHLPQEDAEGIIDMLAHDLKSPSNSIVNGLSLLLEVEEEIAESELGKRMAYTLASARRQLRILDELLDVVRLESDLLTLEVESVDAGAVVHKALAQTRDEFARKRIRLENRVPSKGMPRVRADAGLLHQVVRTLLDNSQKFCIPEDTLTVEMYLDAQDSEHLMLSLTDTGRPVLPEYTGAVFDLLMQWRLRQQGSRTSIAWGLPFCRTALRAMGADIRVESSADGGQTRFVILLPLDT